MDTKQPKKKYGLIIPSKKKAPGNLKRPSAFADSSSEDEVSILR